MDQDIPNKRDLLHHMRPNHGVYCAISADEEPIEESGDTLSRVVIAFETLEDA